MGKEGHVLQKKDVGQPIQAKVTPGYFIHLFTVKLKSSRVCILYFRNRHDVHHTLGVGY